MLAKRYIRRAERDVYRPAVRQGWQNLGLSKPWRNRLAYLLAFAAVLSGFATYLALKEAPPFGNDPDTVIWLLNLDLVLLLLLVALIARRIVGLWSGRKRGLAGSHLHVRLVFTFSLVAAAPAILMTIFSVFFFHFGVQTWLSQRVSTAVNESQAVAEAYLEEHQQVIRADTLAMAGDLDRQASMLLSDEELFERAVQTQSMLRNLSEAIVFDSSGRVLARSGLTFSLEFEKVPDSALRRANDGEVVVMTGSNEDRVRALLKLNNFLDAYLFVGRLVDPQVLAHLDSTRKATQDYQNLQARYADLQVTVTMIFIVVGLVMLTSAIWFGLILARHLVNPIGTLINAADRVRAGDLTARVPDQEKIEEFEYLARAFNRMTKQIEEQQNALIEANRQLDRRRLLTESVLTGVSSGVVGLDARGLVSMTNAAAQDLLNVAPEDVIGRPITDILPAVKPLLGLAHQRPNKMTQGEVMVDLGASKQSFLVRIVMEMIGEKEMGAILTFDDITELQSAQRKAAWSDVARRIAHEIKNPLTPIQLSAERLKRRYLSHIQDDPETFAQCTDTIIRHVEDIGRMVDEFSAFARMPEPVLKRADLADQVKEAMFLQRQAHPQIKMNFIQGGQDSFQARFDAAQIRQALANLLQNAIDSIAGADTKDGRIDILLAAYGSDEAVVAVTDNGPGFPKNENPVHLTDPYVTHKPKGTGLGLAIVKKIMEDHRGRLIMGPPDWLKAMKEWQDLGGASVVLVLPLDQGEWAGQDEAA